MFYLRTSAFMAIAVLNSMISVSQNSITISKVCNPIIPNFTFDNTDCFNELIIENCDNSKAASATAIVKFKEKNKQSTTLTGTIVGYTLDGDNMNGDDRKINFTINGLTFSGVSSDGGKNYKIRHEGKYSISKTPKISTFTTSLFTIATITGSETITFTGRGFENRTVSGISGLPTFCGLTINNSSYTYSIYSDFKVDKYKDLLTISGTVLGHDFNAKGHYRVSSFIVNLSNKNCKEIKDINVILFDFDTNVIKKLHFPTAKNVHKVDEIKAKVKKNTFLASTQKYKIIYDVASSKATYYRYKQSGDVAVVKNIRPLVNKVLDIEYVNYNPYEDSVGVSVQFGDRNEEDAQTFYSAYSQFLAPVSSSEKSIGQKSSINPETLIAQDTNQEAIDTLENLSIIFDKLEILKTNLKTKKDLSFEYAMKEINASISEIRSQKELIKGDFIADMKKVIKATAKQVIKDLANQIINKYNELNNIKFPKTTSIQIDNKDYIDLKIYNYNKPTKDGVDFKRTFLNTGGVKIDFSTGVFLLGLRDYSYHLNDDKFIDNNNPKAIPSIKNPNIDTIIYSPKIDSSKHSIYKNDNGAFNIGFGVLSHIYIRSGIRWNLGLTTGIITDVQTNLRFVAGGSALIGSEKRWVISGGVVFGKAQRLAGNYKEHDFIKANKDESIPLTSKFDYSWFASISYNFGGLNLGSKKTNP